MNDKNDPSPKRRNELKSISNKSKKQAWE